MTEGHVVEKKLDHRPLRSMELRGCAYFKQVTIFARLRYPKLGFVCSEGGLTLDTLKVIMRLETTDPIGDLHESKGQTSGNSRYEHGCLKEP